MCGQLPVLLLLVLLHCLVDGEPRVVDLSHQHKPGIVAYAIYPTMNFTIGSREFHTELGVWLEYNTFQTVEHYGTHVDVPCHLKKGMWRLHEVPLEVFMGPAVVINVTERAKANPDAHVMVADLQAWEEEHGEIPDGAMVLMKSGWDKKFSSPVSYLGSNTPKDASTYHYPAFHGDATKWLVENRPKIHGIGVDTMSLDYGSSSKFLAHVNLFAGNKIGYENLANLDKIPEAGAMFYGVPINLHDGSGCPVRAYASVDSGSHSSKRISSAGFLALLVLAVYPLMV